MKKTTGGYRAAQFETVVAVDKGAYADKFLYVVEGLPGVWRRCKAPKGDPAASGLLPCWYDGDVVYLEHCVSVNDELAHAAVTVENPTELAAFMDSLHQRREDAMMREREAAPKSEPAAHEPGQKGGAESADQQPTDPNGAVAPADDVDV